ncbi:MAG: sugar phosphate isomerase/epimerase [Lentisphaeria bacterium]|nr:sugar phosphate isomerase/epimerase [Lentisphaeria bacterium]
MRTFDSGEKSLKRLAVHTITTKPWSIHEAIQKYSAKGIGGISVWRDTLEGENLSVIGREITDAGLEAVALVRGGFYTGTKEEREKSHEDNLRAIDEAASIGAPQVVLVCGSTPGISIPDCLKQIEDGIGRTVEHAEACGVKLSIEPLHPMYADIRSAVSTMKAANDLCDEINSPVVGVAADVYHIWWDPELEKEIKRCGDADRLFGYHICDWKLDMEDMLQDRGLMGEGVIDVASITRMVDQAGFNGYQEVEVFSKKWWAADQDLYLEAIIDAYLNKC